LSGKHTKLGPAVYATNHDDYTDRAHAL